MDIVYTMKTLHRRPEHFRAAVGSSIEEWVRAQVNGRLKPLQWQRATSPVDRQLGRAWFAAGEAGTTNYAQVKAKTTGNDIAVCLHRPYHGLDHVSTSSDGDFAHDDLRYYITYRPMGTSILISRSDEVKEACDRLLEEYRGRRMPLPFYSGQQSDPPTDDPCRRPQCCQLRAPIETRQGRFQGQPKLMAFLPPHLIAHEAFPVDRQDFRDYIAEKIEAMEDLACIRANTGLPDL